ncbi:MAG: hypothetical protein FJX77_18085 [Armatimonadetes bacterium]|nr:hypothetical protein [Armatimonadota bacterium]
MYHLFYSRRLTQGRATNFCPWSHAVSRDLLHWEEQPDAILPAAAVDGRRLYAARCFYTPDPHLLVGWIPSRQGLPTPGAWTGAAR